MVYYHLQVSNLVLQEMLLKSNKKVTFLPYYLYELF